MIIVNWYENRRSIKKIVIFNRYNLMLDEVIEIRMGVRKDYLIDLELIELMRVRWIFVLDWIDEFEFKQRVFR